MKFKYVGATGPYFDYCWSHNADGYKFTMHAAEGAPKQRFRLVYSNAAGEGYAGFAVCIRVGKKTRKVAE